MALADMAMQVVNFLIIFVTIIFILTIIGAVIDVDSGAGFSQIFEDACSEESGSGMLQDLSYDERSSLIQFMLPISLSGTNDMSMTYPRNTFSILNAYFNDKDCDLQEAADSMAGLYLERKNYKFFETCVDKQCFCAAKTNMDYLTFEDLEYTACFPRLYTFAKGTFNNIISAMSCSNDQAIFKNAVKETLRVLKEGIDCEENCDANFNKVEAASIFDCYNMFLDLTDIGGTIQEYDYEYKGVSGLYTLTLDNPSGTLADASGTELESAITEYYSLTRAGLFSEVLFCTEIPNEGNCYCPYSGNYMISKDSLKGSGLLLGVAGSKTEDVSELDIGSILITISQDANSCTFDTRTIS